MYCLFMLISCEYFIRTETHNYLYTCMHACIHDDQRECIFFLINFCSLGKYFKGVHVLYFLILASHPPISGGLAQIHYRIVRALFYRLLSCLLLAFGMLMWVASVILVFLYMTNPAYQEVVLWPFSGRFLLLFYVLSYMDTILLRHIF